MTKDFAFTNTDGSGFDFAHDGTDLVLGDELETALIHSLFRDGRAPDDLIKPGDDPRGHWSTNLTDDAPDGSLLWLLQREKITPDMPARVADILKNACLWMVGGRDGGFDYVTGVDANCQKAATRGRIEGTLTILLSTAPFNRRFNIVYDDISNQYQFKEIQ